MDKLKKRKNGVAVFNWHGSIFRFEAEVSDEYLWLATVERLYLDNRILLETGGFKISEDAAGHFIDKAGNQHSISFHTRSLINIWQPVSIYIDDILVYKGASPVRGLLKALIIYFPIGVLIGLGFSWLGGLINLAFRFPF